MPSDMQTVRFVERRSLDNDLCPQQAGWEDSDLMRRKYRLSLEKMVGVPCVPHGYTQKTRVRGQENHRHGGKFIQTEAELP